MTVRPYVMWHTGAIPNVPGPNGGLWPGGITVYVDEETNEVLRTSPITQHPLDETPLVQQVHDESNEE